MAAESMTPAAKERTMSEKRWVIFLKIKPSSEPITVAPPTPRAVINTIFIDMPPSGKSNERQNCFVAFYILYTLQLILQNKAQELRLELTRNPARAIMKA